MQERKSIYYKKINIKTIGSYLFILFFGIGIFFSIIIFSFVSNNFEIIFWFSLLLVLIFGSFGLYIWHYLLITNNYIIEIKENELKITPTKYVFPFKSYPKSINIKRIGFLINYANKIEIIQNNPNEETFPIKKDYKFYYNSLKKGTRITLILEEDFLDVKDNLIELLIEMVPLTKHPTFHFIYVHP